MIKIVLTYSFYSSLKTYCVFLGRWDPSYDLPSDTTDPGPWERPDWPCREIQTPQAAAWLGVTMKRWNYQLKRHIYIYIHTYYCIHIYIYIYTYYCVYIYTYKFYINAYIIYACVCVCIIYAHRPPMTRGLGFFSLSLGIGFQVLTCECCMCHSKKTPERQVSYRTG